MSYVERLKTLIVKHGGSINGVKTVSDAIAVLEGLETKGSDRTARVHSRSDTGESD